MSIDGTPSEQTALPESIIVTGGELKFVLAAQPDKNWGSDPHCAPPSFSGGGSALTINVRPAVVMMSPGSSRTVDIDLQRMIEGPAEYRLTATSSRRGIAGEAVSGQLRADGSATATTTITAARSVVAGDYPVVLTVALDGGVRTFTLIVAVT